MIFPFTYLVFLPYFRRPYLGHMRYRQRQSKFTLLLIIPARACHAIELEGAQLDYKMRQSSYGRL